MQSHTPASEGRITRWLRRAPAIPFMLYAVGAAFCTYFCMYGFRKAFGAATYDGQGFQLGDHTLTLKSALVISQLVGYTLSKYIGVKYLSELRPERRVLGLVGAIVVAELALVCVGLLPPGGRVLAIFFNGLPLGVVWGLVYSFLEGRTTSEILGAGLSCSYIIASGFAKTVGRQLMDLGVPDHWMAAVTGVCYLPFFLCAVWLLKQLPSPSPDDVAQRVRRDPMDARERREFLRRYFLGLSLLLVLYFFLTAYRDYRDNFQREIFGELGVDDPAAFTKTEIPVGVLVLGGMALIYLVKDNRRGFFFTHLMMASGTILIGVSTLLLDTGKLDGLTWMILVGVGLYLAYVPFGCVLFDRLIAAMRTVGTAVFMIYVADALGYTGSIGVVLYKNFGQEGMSHLEFFRYFSYFTAVFCTACFLGSFLYFRTKTPVGR